MARRKQEEEHENHERWMVSYADFLTLLSAFFVVMYAISSVNEGKYRVLSESIVSAFRNETVSSGGQSIVVIQASSSQPKQVEPNKTQDLAKQRQREKMRNVAKDILEVLAPLVQEGKVRVLETTRGVTIEINDSILFSPGQAQLHPTSVKAMQAVAEVLAASDFPIIIEGHTDNVPINTLQFPSNWELSAVRATTVLRLFADAGVGAERLTAIGYGETRPVEPNLLAEGRARNRRVTIMIESVVPEKGREVRLDAGPADAQAAGGVTAAGASQAAAR